MEVSTTAAEEAALRVALVAAFTPRRWRRYLEEGGDPALLPHLGPGALGSRLGIGRSEAAALVRALARADPGRELARAAAAGIRAAPWGAAGYPARLRHLADPPPAVFLRGALLGCDECAVAVVGSRRASPYGLRMARTLATDLARAGVSVVSGLARGVDAAAHEGALAAGGRTIAVLGSGLLKPYPPEHADLLERVATSGAVLSEFPLETPPARPNFPRRNRLVAALSLGVVVVEAGERSGALSTVGHALDLGRTVMAVPGPVDEPQGRGVLRLLREGAFPVGSAVEIFEALGWCEAPATPHLRGGEQRVFEAIPDEGASALDVAAATGLGPEVAAGLLVRLEVQGLVERSGGKYIKNP